MRVSKFVKVDTNVLLEYIYDDGNNIGDSYKVLSNIKSNSFSYVAGSASSTNNNPSNQLFKIDSVTNNYGLVDINNYGYLQYRDYASGFPLRHDTITLHFPINYTFGEYIGCYIRVYAFDYNNQVTYDLSNFFFDVSDINQSYLLNYTAPPLLFQETLWGKEITINFPSIYAVANQRQNNAPSVNSINYNLTNGIGLSLNSPIFIDFSFINTKKTVNSVTTYYLTTRVPVSLPQTPDFEKLGVMVQHSSNGDYFEIFGTYNGTIGEFNSFINNSVQLGNRYYAQYTITLYEQNIRGKSIVVTMTDSFNETVEYRPIIKYSTTTAIIDVELNIIDAVDNSSIYRRASYGMLQDEVAKYSLSLTKINIANASKPKIYNIKNYSLPSSSTSNQSNPQVILNPIKVNYTVLSSNSNVVAKSDNAIVGTTTFFGIGNLQIVFYPFDNVIKLIVAQDVTSSQVATNNGNGTNIQPSSAPKYMDMSNMGDINFYIKNDKLSVSTNLYMASNEVDLVNGVVVFKIQASRMNDVKTIYSSGVNVFYVTGTTDTGTSVIYSGLFTIYDSTDNVVKLNSNAATIQSNLSNPNSPSIIVDPSLTLNNTTTPVYNPQSIPPMVSSASSNTSATITNGVTVAVNADSSVSINGYAFSSSDIKTALNLDSSPTNITLSGNALYTNNKYVGTLDSVKTSLESTLTTPDKKAIYTSTQLAFKNNNTKP